jgi:hypothetical protein
MCWAPRGAGSATFVQAAGALAEVVLEEGAAAAVLVAEPAAVLLVDFELELLPHPAIAKATAMIGNALRTRPKETRSAHGDTPKLWVDSPLPLPPPPGDPPALELPEALPAADPLPFAGGSGGGGLSVWVLTPAGVVTWADLTV